MKQDFQTAIAEKCRYLEQCGRFSEEKNAYQHGMSTVYRHSILVAAVSLSIADKLGLPVNRDNLIRGALLHDYFLYDWHEKDRSHCLHGFRHPSTALKNARADYPLNRIEKNIIARHMFPLTPIPQPVGKHGWYVSQTNTARFRKPYSRFWPECLNCFHFFHLHLSADSDLYL